MMLSAILAASLSFTATATGVEKGTPVEFVFAGRNTDRDYESMFLIEDTVDAFCTKLERAGLPRGKPTDSAVCRLWPVGCRLKFEPSLASFIDGKMPEGLTASDSIYTGGTRLAGGGCEASTNMPASVFSIYSLSQSPIVYNGIYDQGAVYGSFTAGKTLKKGERVSFTVSWDAETLPRAIHLTIRPGNSTEVLRRLKDESAKGELDVLVGFDKSLTVAEAVAAANALAVVDSPRIKINGCSNIFYRSFLPLVKWQDRKERLVQPFELTVGDPDKLVFVEEDWTVEGTDPKLTPREIPFADAVKHTKTDTCFIYADGQTTVARIQKAMSALKDCPIRNWYVFSDNTSSLHNADCTSGGLR